MYRYYNVRVVKDKMRLAIRVQRIRCKQIAVAQERTIKFKGSVEH